MEDFVRKTKGVRDINSLPLNVNHELDIVSDVKGKIYIKILNRYKELLFDNGTEQWVIDMLNNLEVDVEQLKEDILDVEQALSELPMIEDKLNDVETKLAQINTLFTQIQTDVNGLDLRTAELEREVIQLALKDQELLDKINNLDVDLDILYSNSDNFGDYDYNGNPNLAPQLTFNSFTVGGSATKVDGEEYIKFHKPAGTSGYMQANFPYPKLSTNHTLTVEVYIEETTAANLFYTLIGIKQGTKPSYTNLIRLTNQPVGHWVTLSNTAISPTNAENPQLLYVYTRSEDTMDLRIRYTIKLEEGSTATPYQPNLLNAPYYLSKVALSDSISYYKYVGINLTESKNPNDYHWIPLAKAAETVDARLTKTITTNDTVNALQNSRLTALESKVVDTAWTKITPISPFTATKQIQVKRQNGIVYMRGGLSDGTGDCFTLPEGFRPPNDGYEYHYLLPGQSTAQTDTAKIYVRPSGLCSIISKTGTVPTLLEPIMFSIT